MTAKRIGLVGVQVEGPNVAPASIDFAPNGLTVISGASDTGKTYILNTIDFLLGSSSPPPDNPASKGYTRAILEIEADGKQYCIGRNFRENSVFLFEGPLSEFRFESAQRQLSSAHKAGSSDTLSHFLLSFIGLEGKQIRKNQYAEKASLTIRHLAHTTVISEERIISKSSPAVTGDLVLGPLERSIFSFFLTGIDDAELTTLEKPKDRKTRLDTEEVIIRSMLEPKELQLQKLVGDEKDAKARLEKIDTSINEAMQMVSATQQEIDELEEVRKESWDQLQRHKSRHLFVSEQLKRFLLLTAFYKTDRERLESVMEAGKTFESLPGGECAVCGSLPSTSPLANTVAEFNAACLSELEKVRQLSSELAIAITDTRAEETSLLLEMQRLEGSLAQAEQKIREILEPRSHRADSGLTQLVKLRGDVGKAVYLESEINDLNSRLAAIEAARKSKPEKTNATSIGVAHAARFCEVIQATLNAWKYPLNGNVAFDPDQKKFDIVVGNQDRGSMGKGYRAITHAAFVISLMRYCRKEGIPHPGFVVLDTPLNPFKGPNEPDGKVNDQIKDAFFNDLASDNTGDQFIILENTEPPANVIAKIRYHHFTKNSNSGRYGFFPILTSLIASN